MKAYKLYRDLLRENHILIGGATGSGKSVVINALVYHSFEMNSRLILIDPKKVELAMYRGLPQTICYADEKSEMISALQKAVDITENRYREMQAAGLRLYQGPDVYVIIDELADLMTTCRREVEDKIQRLGQIGRAAKVHLIMATQCPLASVIPTPIKCNCDVRLGLRTACAQDSRNIIGVKGCEALPDPRKAGKGYGIIRWAGDIETWTLPMIPEADIQEAIETIHRKRAEYQANVKSEKKKQKGFFGRLFAIA